MAARYDADEWKSVVKQCPVPEAITARLALLVLRGVGTLCLARRRER
jgi:hypothetical protein